MNRHSRSPRRPPADQASGLRRLFHPVRRHLLPVVANPFIPGAQAVLEALSAALAAMGRQVLVVDAASTAPVPHETACFDLASGVEQLHDQVSYLAARGLPLTHVDTHGSASSFVDAAYDAAPRADVMVLHGDPTDLARMLVRRAVRPLLLGSDRPESIKQAYAGCKLLAQRCGLMTFDLAMAAAPYSRRIEPIADRLASCADNFLGAVLYDWVVIDPDFDPMAPNDPALARLLSAQLALDDDPQPLLAPRRASATRTAPSGAALTPF
jgi:hypothetical protein